MYAVGRLGSYISRGVYTVSGPFHPFGGAVDIIVVEQEDGSFKSSAWNVCFGKFQGVLKSKEKVVKICVNGEEANFHMYLDNKGEAYFLRETDVKEGESVLCPSSFSSDDTDEQSPEEPLKSRQPLNSKSCNYDAEILTGEKCNGKVLSRNNSRKSRIFGIFGNRSMKERKQGDDGTVARVDSLERAEFAANLLDVQWSTSLATKKIKKENSSRFSSDILDNGVNEDMQINSELRRVTSSLSDSAVYEAATFCNDQIIYPEEASPDIVSRVRRELDESGVIENDGNVVAVVSSITGSDPPIPHSAEMEAFPGSFDGKGVVPPDYVISPKDGEIDRVQSFIYCQSSGDPVVGTNGSGERTHETLYIARGGSGQVHLHAEAVHARTKLISKDTAAELLVEDISLKEQTMKVPETYTQETAIHSCTGNHNGDLEVPAKAPDPCGQMGHRNASPDSVEEIESHILSGLSNGDHQVQDEKDIRGEEITCDAQTSSGYSDGSDIKEAKSVPQGILEEEQFLFSDSEELNITKVQYMESSSSLCENGEASLLCSPDPSKELNGSEISTNYELYSSPETVAQEDPSSGFGKSIGKLKAASTTIGISRTHEAAEKEVGRLVESLPNMWHQTDTLSALDLHYPLSHSLDSNVKTLKWLQQHKEDLNWKNLDKEQQQEVVKLEIENAQGTVALKDVPGSPAVGDPSKAIITSRGSWKLWPFRRTNSRKAMLPNVNDGKNSDAENTSVSTLDIDDCKIVLTPKGMKKMERASSPTSEQLASLNLKEGRNTVTFTFSTAMLGNQQVDARIYLWKWNARIVISDVDGTITKSDVLGQFMPMVGVDWSHTGVTHLFSAIKENGYEMLFLSARAISQAYHTRQFLFNLKQDGKALPDGPVVISPDGLFPSLFREVIRRAPHEFKIACLEGIKSLFPSDCNPFYAGFGNRDTDEISYLRVGIPLGKIFIINPKGKVVVNRRVDSKSYTSLHALVNGMFPPTTFSPQQEDFNSWNYWKLPLPHISV